MRSPPPRARAQAGLAVSLLAPPLRSRPLVQVRAALVFEPEKVNIFNRDCRRGGKDVACMAAIVCLGLHATAGTGAPPPVGEDAARSQMWGPRP